MAPSRNQEKGNQPYRSKREGVTTAEQYRAAAAAELERQARVRQHLTGSAAMPTPGSLPRGSNGLAKAPTPRVHSSQGLTAPRGTNPGSSGGIPGREMLLNTKTAKGPKAKSAWGASPTAGKPSKRRYDFGPGTRYRAAAK